MSNLNAYWLAVVASLFCTFVIIWAEYRSEGRSLTKGGALLAFIACFVPFVNILYTIISGLIVACFVYEEYLSDPLFK